MATTQPATSPNASAKSLPGNGLLYFVAAMCVMLGYLLQQSMVRGRLWAVLQGHPEWWLYVALVVGLVVVGFGALDFNRARQRGYEPPSMRVRVARAIAYGIGLSLALVGTSVAVRPELFDVLLGAQWWNALLCAFVAPFGYAAFVLCLTPRTFVVPELPTFQEAAKALQDTNDFVLGKTGTDWKSGGGDPRWCVMPEKSLYTNVYALGGIGSGKTTAVSKTLLEQMLFKFPKDGKRKIGGFVYDPKGDDAAWLRQRARAAGREEDLVVIEPGGAQTMNLIDATNPTVQATMLMASLETMTSQESNTYYLKMATEFATHAFQVLQEVMGVGRFTLLHVYEFMTDPEAQTRYLDRAKPGNSLSYRWFQTQWAKEDPKERMMLTKGFRADLAAFVSPELAPTFCVVDGSFAGWDSIIAEGKIVVFSMSMSKWAAVGRAFAIFCLMAVQQRLLARSTTEFRESGGNVDRLVMLFLDEAWALMNPGIADFTSVSRQAKCCTVALNQSLGQIPERYRDVMLGNFRTHVVLGVNDPLTLDTFSKLFGTHRTIRGSRSQSSAFSGVEKQLLTDHQKARAGGESVSVSVSESEVDEPRFTLDDILRLPQQRAVVQQYDGRTTLPPTVVELLQVIDDPKQGVRQNLLG